MNIKEIGLWFATILILLLVIMMSSSIRLSNLDLLVDSTTGENIPLALDPYYFLRISETIVETNGDLPEFDSMRVHGFDVDWSPEVLPQVVVWMWKASSLFGNYSLQTINIISPVIFFGIGLIFFFFLVYFLTKSKLASVLACTILSLTPIYLYRTMAGFSDHEAIGMVGFFAAMLVFVLSMRYLEKLKKTNLVKSGIIGLILGLFTAIASLCWGGVAVFLFMIFPIAFLLFWVINLKDEDSSVKNNGLMFYLSWIVSSVLFASLFGFDTLNFIGRYITGSNGVISLGVLGFIIVDRLFLLLKHNTKYRILYSSGATMALGLITLPLIGKNLFVTFWETLNRLLNPAFGTGRVGSTIAENAQPYLVNWISAAGSQIFWLFIAGIILIGFVFSKNIKDTKNKYLLSFGFIAMIFGILFSRISPTSILDGAGIFSFSGLLYLGGVGIFIFAFLKNYFNEPLKIESSILILFSWLFVMLVVGRSTNRMFFVIAPFMCLASAYFIVEMFKKFREKDLEEVSKILVIGVLIVSVFVCGMSIYSSYNSISDQAKYTGVSANLQWQNAMSWVRDNTASDAVFSHWWDYGYWIQTLGERATMADGGHAQGIYDGNHKIGRYVLTTPSPETALSFFKTMEVDYLLIDQTDLGKYPAYSKIGGGNDASGETGDRFSSIPIFVADERQTIETSNGVMFVYGGGSYLFEDIIYEMNGTKILLPASKAAVVGITLKIEDDLLMQPEVIYIYNNIYTTLPARYAYIDGKIADFGSGLDIVIQVIPSFNENGINPAGAVIYLSQKVSKSLFAQVYLMDNVFGEYNSLNLVHVEDDPIITSMRSQGVPVGDFIYYNGFRGPIKIWDVSNVPTGINVVKEFRDKPTGEYGSLDDLDFGSY